MRHLIHEGALHFYSTATTADARLNVTMAQLRATEQAVTFAWSPPEFCVIPLPLALPRTLRPRRRSRVESS